MIESLHSPHIARVKALIGSRGSRERRESVTFVAEGLQCVREALSSQNGPRIETLYVTAQGLAKIANFDISEIKVCEVSIPVMQAMSDTVTPQGVLSICRQPRMNISDLKTTGSSRFIYLFEIADPGNAGTILRTAAAMGVCAVITSPGSVDMYSPKVVRSTAGSLWHVPVFEGVDFEAINTQFPELKKILLTPHARESILDITVDSDCIAIFGNEARGVRAQELGANITEVKIPMVGSAESLNLVAAAAIVIFMLSIKSAG